MTGIHNERIKKLLEHMAEQEADAFIIHSVQNLFYLTGFLAHEAGYLIIDRTRTRLLTNFIYAVQARPYFDAIEGGELIDAKGKSSDLIKEILSDKEKVLFEGTLPYNEYKKFCDLTSDKVLHANNSILSGMRIIKHECEVNSIRKALELTEKGLEYIFTYIRAGMKECQIRAELERYLTENGAQGMSFDSIIAAGKNSAFPHAKTGNTPVLDGDFLKMDFGIVIDGYCSDLTRTVVIGHASDRHKEIYETVKSAQAAAIEAIKPGMKGREADAVARDVIVKSGNGEFFGHGLGHGVGIDIHEAPRLAMLSEEILKPGMVATVEPGIYLPGFGGVRIEDMVLITDTGCMSLNKSDRELTVI
ncbi:MAG: aminopeptidase P family protein [Candidatus Wallbacteria bacterium]|nr:aminopeptidase P family protein [Candidatus Wallbacteria bacterium]